MASPAQIVRWIGLGSGPLVGIAAFAMLPAAQFNESGEIASGLSVEARSVAGVAALMAVWWLTEAIPLYATALLPIALFPLVGATTIAGATAPYANNLIYLFMGGFILGLGMEKWGLHRRIALMTIRLVGSSPGRIVAGFMLASAVMSMWVSNTATAVMMLPIGVSVVSLVHARLGDGRIANNFATCLMLGIAYACSIGGIGTIIGTPPNIVLAGFVEEQYGVKITMLGWFKIGLPLVGIFLPLTWVLLTRVIFPIKLKEIPGGAGLIKGELSALGELKRGEWVVFIVFVLMALAWIFSPLLERLGHATGFMPLTRLTDSGIAMIGALSLFVIPINPKEQVFAMDWQTATRLPWGILLLFGGGLSLASAMTSTGLDAYLGELFTRLGGVPVVVLIGALVLGVIFLTEMTSNTAVTTSLMPVLAAAAVGMDIPPQMLLVPAALAASCAFMLPVATPPNAIVFGSGRVTINQMIKAGLWLNLLGAVIVTILCVVLVPILAPGGS